MKDRLIAEIMNWLYLYVVAINTERRLMLHFGPDHESTKDAIVQVDAYKSKLHEAFKALALCE